MTLLLFVAAVAAMAAAGYAQHRIPRHTAGRRRLWFLRAVLFVVGLALGHLSSSPLSDPFLALLAFLIGFGEVHVPAAIILFIKQERGAAKS